MFVSSPVSTAAMCLVSSNPSDGLAALISDAITVRSVVFSGLLMTVITLAMDAFLPDDIEEDTLTVTTAGWSDIVGGSRLLEMKELEIMMSNQSLRTMHNNIDSVVVIVSTCEPEAVSICVCIVFFH
mmetsp:Transcript_14273/g.22032  ORF Transcript_14273/g.22032 Transcript_14273/m.22032 type:complete len:127 (+) Transcript_14273:1897-2277(+)